jgi:signal transduction histidine kinase
MALVRLMAVAGHDLQQPLHIALAAISRAASDGGVASPSRHLAVATHALQRLGSELEDLARVSQSADGLAPTLRTTPLAQVLRQIEADWRAYAEVCGVEFRLLSTTAYVRTDGAMLRTILRNLVGNALKYSGRGGRVLVGCRQKPDHVLIEVHDNGCGIGPARLTEIFKAFRRFDDTGAIPGLGLGLHIVRQTAEALGYPITVRSVEGRGSSFAVTVPLAVLRPASMNVRRSG